MLDAAETSEMMYPGRFSPDSTWADRGSRVQVALVAGLVHTALWLSYQYRIRDRPYAKRGAIIIILLNAAILLEAS